MDSFERGVGLEIQQESVIRFWISSDGIERGSDVRSDL